MYVCGVTRRRWKGEMGGEEHEWRMVRASSSYTRQMLVAGGGGESRAREMEMQGRCRGETGKRGEESGKANRRGAGE